MTVQSRVLSLLRLVLWIGLLWPAGHAAAQDARSIAGTYVTTSNTPFGENPRGQLILTQDGRYSIILARSALPKFAANSRLAGTAEENKAVVEGSIGHFGTYSIDEKEMLIVFNIETCTFPNWDGMTFKRPFKMNGDQLSWQNSAPSSGGPAIESAWRRVR